MRLVTLVACAALAGCARNPEPTLGVAGYCDVARPIYWSAKDTRQTKEQVDREDAKWKVLCDNKKDDVK